ncbi:sulfatase-like hydrolase/transferase [Saliphagus infecundisoli]|uniref:Sulfatase-like hydrolase/transferase n=1 Tax=Saliphagus infecundisoli TaxID=1849069 RepID=A0ABD5QAZ1_9EURY|nr:sulfatase-like hydrolase/transferase [Saliphagus infecundisoli]
MPDRPNILFLMDDEHRPDVLGYAGDDTVRTPTIDSLAETGTVFTNAYTPSPVCVPARQSLMAGELPRTCGCLGWDDLDPEYYTFSRHFAEYGYMTTCAGKLHHQGWDQMQGWRKRLGPTPMKRPLHHKYLEKKDPDAFDRWEKDYDPGSEWKWSYSKEVRRAGVGDSRVQVQDRRSVEGTEQYISQYFNSPYYDRQRADERPLLLKVSLIQPHFPFFTTQDKFEYYLNRVDPYLEEPPDHSFLRKYTVEPGVDASERELRRATAAYYGMVETVDDYFGRIMAALEAAGENLEEWIIVYTSDHGEMLGEHGVWEKKKFYEASVRVPLVIRWPERFDSGRVEKNVNLCDLYATLAELAGLPIPDGLDSRSLVPLIEGVEDDWQNETVSQFDGQNLMIKQDHLKYQYYGEELPEILWDLERDSSETRNFIDDPEYTDAVDRFRDRRDELGYGPNPNLEYEGAGY